MPKIPQILLAAGASTRMGEPKALLPWGAKSLLEHRLEVLKELGQPIVLVLGAHSKEIKEQLPLKQMDLVEASDWDQGMGSSIAAGMAYVMEHFPQAEGLLISLVDQPLIPSSHYQKMLAAFQKHPNKIIVSEAESGWRGVPVLFPRTYFSELKALSGEATGKTLLKRHPDAIKTVPGGDYLMDMDNPEAYASLLKRAGLG